MTKKERWIVVGGGFKGLMASFMLAKQENPTILFESYKSLGGVLFSEEWEQFYIDKGCHLFDNNDVFCSKILLEIMDNEIVPVYLKLASISEGNKMEEMGILDLTYLDKNLLKDILYEVLQVSAYPQDKGINLLQKLKERFGETASNYLKPAVYKVYALEAEKIDPQALYLTMFSRIKVTDNKIGGLLKANPVLDDKLAISSFGIPLKFYKEVEDIFPARNFYPRFQGLRGFCNKIQEKLLENNVTIFTGSAIKDIRLEKGVINVLNENGEIFECDKIFWAGSLSILFNLLKVENNLKELIHNVPMILYYFIIPADELSDYTYIHNFDLKDLIFRVSFPTNYSKNNGPDGKAYLCCEVTTEIGSEIWKNPELFYGKIWSELKRFGFVRADSPISQTVLKTPVSYSIPKIGYFDEIKRLNKLVDKRIFGVEIMEYSKNQIIKTLKKVLNYNI